MDRAMNGRHFLAALKRLRSRRPRPGFLCVWLILLTLTGCATPDWLPTSGPSASQIQEQTKIDPPILVVDVTDSVARRAIASEKRARFTEVFSSDKAAGYRVGPGDFIEISLWEAPPATLFGSAALDPRMGVSTSRVTTLPEQMVSHDGAINVPFAGNVPVSGKSLPQVEMEIARRLQDKANQPQVLARVTRNATSNVTVVGEVAQSQRVPLTAKGERLLDAIAAAGGVRQPVNKVTVQLTRGPVVQSMPLEQVIQSPGENIPLAPGDVVTVRFQPLSFTVLGATGKNEEINFEAQGISLAQALARAGGMQDTRADARGVFIFRFEDALALGEDAGTSPRTPEGQVPVIYRLDMKNPVSFLVAQNFPMRNRDVVYVANAPAAELQKFLNILTSSIFSVSSLANINATVNR